METFLAIASTIVFAAIVGVFFWWEANHMPGTRPLDPDDDTQADDAVGRAVILNGINPPHPF